MSAPQSSLVGDTGLAEAWNAELQSADATFQTTVHCALNDWLDRAPRLLASRQLNIASFHAQEFGMEIEAIRLGHTPNSDRASQALDHFVCAARSAVEVSGLEDPKKPGLSWHERTQALARNFEAQERAWTEEKIAGPNFMRGHLILVRDAIDSLASRLGLPLPEVPPPSENIVAKATPTLAGHHRAAYAEHR